MNYKGIKSVRYMCGHTDSSLSSALYEHGNSYIRGIVFLFHGYGSNADNMIQIAHAISSHSAHSSSNGDKANNLNPFRNILFIAPDGLDAFEQSAGFGGRQWFSLRSLAAQDMIRECGKNLPAIKNYVLHEVSKYNIGLNAVILAGFSQGAMLSLEMGLMSSWDQDCAVDGVGNANENKNSDNSNGDNDNDDDLDATNKQPSDSDSRIYSNIDHSIAKPLGIISMSGGLLGVGVLNRKILNKTPYVLITHGSADTVVPSSFSLKTKSILDADGIKAELVIDNGGQHTIDSNAMRAVRDFCSKRFMHIR